MNYKAISLGTLVYTVTTFAWAVAWHIGLFEAQYRAFGYIQGEPNFLLGFITIIIQGILLSALYPHIRLSGSPWLRGLKFSIVLGLFFWTCHVLGYVAKQDVNQPLLFTSMESFYLLIQFGVYGLLIGRIYAKSEKQHGTG